MAVAYVSGGTAGTGTTSLSVPYTTVAANNYLLLPVFNKYPTNGPATPSGWGAPTNYQQSGGAGSSGADAGNVYVSVFTKTATGSESGSVSITLTSANSSSGRMFRFSCGAGSTWDVQVVGGSNNSAGTSWSVTTGSLDVQPGDIIFAASTSNTDAFTYSAQDIAMAGITFDTAVEVMDANSPTGDDHQRIASYHTVLTGSTNNTATYTMTASGSTANSPAGATVLVRLREIRHISLTATGGSCSVSGTAADLNRALIVSASSGSFAESGQTAGLAAGRMLTGSSGSFSVSGQSSSLTATRLLTATGGSSSVTGSDAGLLRAASVTASSGSFAHSGQSASLVIARTMAGASGSIVITGQDASVVRHLHLSASSGSFAETGSDANLAATRRLTADASSVSLAGSDAGVRAARALTCASTAFLVEGFDLLQGLGLQGSSGAFVLTGGDAAFKRALNLAADPGSFSTAGIAGLLYGRALDAGTGAYSVAGTDTTSGRALVASDGSFGVAGSSVQLVAARVLSAGSGSVSLTGTAATLSRGASIASDLGGTLVKSSTEAGGSILRPEIVSADLRVL